LVDTPGSIKSLPGDLPAAAAEGDDDVPTAGVLTSQIALRVANSSV